MIVSFEQQEYRDSLARLEAYSLTLPQIDVPVKHCIHGGMYAREITIPKGVTITGQIYKYDHLEFMIAGDATVATMEGPVRLKGFHTLSGHHGKKRAISAHEDTIWLTVHTSSGTDGDKIQNLITASDFDELEQFYTEQKQIEVN